MLKGVLQGPGGVAIGKPVLGGAANAILYEDSLGNVASSANLTFGPTAGQGITLNAGTATTAVSPLALTQTWNAAGTTFPGLTLTITDIASAAGSLALQILGGAAGTTNLFSLSRLGAIVTPSTVTAVGFYLGNGSAGWYVSNRFTFGPTGIFGWGLTNGYDTPDTCISRLAAGVIGIGTGATGSVAGTLDATLYRAAGTAGVATFGPSAVTSITVKGGIITAIS
jgi:hypothetical protein